jgi:serine/threonine protein kinase
MYSSNEDLVQAPPWVEPESIINRGSSAVVVATENPKQVIKWINEEDRYCILREIFFHTILNTYGVVPRLHRVKHRKNFVGIRMNRCVPLRVFVQEEKLQKLERLKLVHELLVAVNVLHMSGLTHQDLKLANLGVCKTTHKVVLFDFGLTLLCNTSGRCPLDAEVEINGRETMTFTAHVRPPEVVLGAPWRGPENDVWALGVLIAKILQPRTVLAQYKKRSGYKLQNEVLRYVAWDPAEARELAELKGYARWLEWVGVRPTKLKASASTEFGELEWELIKSCLRWNTAARPKVSTPSSTNCRTRGRYRTRSTRC